ncbi:MAG TPA: hypothetical protein VGN20_21525 [Mucilaginibacter sp.]|jgi:hypothetical protein
MKIVFLCSSLEPGRDGVGDYTRRLAAELIRQGHFSAALSLNDKFTSDKINGTQQSEGIDLPVMRLPELWPMKIKLAHAKKYINDFNPDWLSLQFVIFGFHNKGLPFRLGSQLALLCQGRRLQIMFHELWVGMAIETSQKLKWWGRIQRFLIKSMVYNLNPSVVHTQATLYNLQLAKLGIQSKYLPLFTNIPLLHNVIPRPLTNSEEGNRIIKLIVFGSIYKGVSIDMFAKEVSLYGKKTNTRIILTLLGRCDKKEQDNWIETWQSYGLDVELLGEQSAGSVAEIFSVFKFGIATTPLAMTEKSGSVAAMRAYGMKMICISHPWRPRGIKDFKLPDDILEYTEGSFETFVNNKVSNSVAYSVSEIAKEFGNDLMLT